MVGRMSIADLKQFEDCNVEILLTDGEVLRAAVVFVDVEYEDLILDVIDTSRPEHYKNLWASYAVAAADIVTARISN